MTEFKIVLADPKSGKSYNINLNEDNSKKLVGCKIGDIINGEIFGFENTYHIKITGGSDKSGFTMRKDINGQNKRKILSVKGIGFHPKISGKRKRKFIRGNEISQDIIQINTMIIDYGSIPLDSYFKINKNNDEK